MLIAWPRNPRGFRQWQEVGRYVKKIKAITILAPRFIKKQNEEEEKKVFAGRL